MKVNEISKLIGGTILSAEHKQEVDIESAFASDMMSDVLAYVQNQSLLITGLTNPQIVRTAELMDMTAIIIVRGKKLEQSVIDLANAKDILIISTPCKMFETSGILYQAGIRS